MTGGGRTVRDAVAAVDRGQDLHTHSDLTDGADSPEAMADAAVAAGLHTWGLSDHVRADSDWLPAYVERVRALERPGLTIRVGVETKLLDHRGKLDLPDSLPELDYVLIADHQYPSPRGPLHPREVKERLATGQLDVREVLDTLVGSTAAAVMAAPFPAVVVHPFSLLPKMGLSEADLHDDHLTTLAATCRHEDAAVEINEKWSCPSPSTVACLRELGVRLVAGSDAHRGADVGRWTYLDTIESSALGPS